MNRTIFDVNDFLDRLLLRPIAELYRATIPPGIRDRVAGIVTNMKEPVIFANNLLQGEFSKAGVTAERFAINTTIGVGGSFDWANDWHMYQQTGDFGQTLYSWGVGPGPYVVLPLLGPYNARDALGYGVDSAASPWQYLADMGGSDRPIGNSNMLDTGMDGIARRFEDKKYRRSRCPARRFARLLRPDAQRLSPVSRQAARRQRHRSSAEV